MSNPASEPTNATLYTDVLADLKALLPRNYIGGLITSNDADADHDVNIAAGECRGLADDESLRLATEITKRIDAAWAVGDDAGGLDTGSVVANQMYLFWLIKRTDTGVVDAVFSILGLLQQVITVSAATADDSYNDAVEDLSIFKPGQTIYVEGFTDAANNGLKTVVTSAANKITVSENLADEAAGDTVTITARVTGPIMPTDYDKKRLISSVCTDGASNIIAFTQSGDYFRYTSATDLLDVDDNTIVQDVWKTGTLSTPPSALAHIYAYVSNAGENVTKGKICIKTKGAGDAANYVRAFASVSYDADNFESIASIGMVLVDSARQIEYATTESAGVATVRVMTIGFTMLSRREP